MVAGGSLDSFKQGNTPPPDQAVDLLLQATHGLRAAAEEGIIHRDIKPSNLMLAQSGFLKITDFGLAKTVAIDSALTHTGTIIGTPYYMSPEQGEGEALDQRADIYSLGATFYHLLAGSPPFEADSPIGVILKHINEPLPPLRSRNKKVPKGLALVIEKMMAKDPGERYETYAELEKDLNALKKGLKPSSAGRKKDKRAAARAAGPQVGDERKKSFVVLDRQMLETEEQIELRRCGMFRRLLAFAADFAVLCVLYNLYLESEHPLKPTGESGKDTVWCALFLVISFLYFFLSDARGGMTLGKIFFRCRVGRQDGENIGFRNALVRAALFFPTLFAPGAMMGQGDLTEDHPFMTFAAAGKGLLDAAGFSQHTAYIIAQICLVWLVISFGFFLLTPGRTFLHDLISKSFAFHFSRRRPAADEQEGAPKIETGPVREVQKTPQPVNATSPPAGMPVLQGKMPPPIPMDARQVTAQYPFRKRPKNPRMAMFLSIFPGLGQLYNGDFMKGFLILCTCWLIFPWVLGIFDAYFKAKMINRQAGYYA
jgi:uncharacterized RDD family membrane protein YckC